MRVSKFPTGRLFVLTGLLFLVIPPLRLPVLAAVDWPQLEFLRVEGEFDRPLQITHAGDGSGRLFVAGQGGLIDVIRDGNVLREPFLEITNRVISEFERGLLGIAFPPNYARKKYFYAFYSRAPDGYLVLSRFHVPGNPNQADKQTEERLLVVEHGSPWHNGGQIAFGPDGLLYLSIGDGLSPERAQDVSSLLGKILRIDVESGKSSYVIPASNPFVGREGYRPEIWALGLRNPWRFSFDRETADLYIGDVGDQSQEEIDFQATGSLGGQNYGWPTYEGNVNGYWAQSVVLPGATAPVA